jgi:murein DD-endopeptidase MepM/ murein hydrolase activator NlpD
VRRAVRLGVVLCVLMAIPVVASSAAAQLPPIPIPDLPELPGLPDPIPDPPEPDPEATPPTQDEPPDESGPVEDPPATNQPEPESQPAAGDVAGDGAARSRPTRRIESQALPTFDYARIPGAYSTDGLMMAAARLRSLGWTQEDVIGRVFAPFIIAGRANWVDSWGAARYGPGPTVRRHEGQDVFCEYGDPVLAVERGTVSYGEGGLGGVVARLQRPSGGYWYYAHLSGTNETEFPNGSPVERGDVLGFCGNSGNAITTPPHVHFGWYRSTGIAANPMTKLVAWLERAERDAALTVARAEGRRVTRLGSLTSARRFGDGLVPGIPTRAHLPAVSMDLGRNVLAGAMAGYIQESGAIAEESAD